MMALRDSNRSIHRVTSEILEKFTVKFGNAIEEMIPVLQTMILL